MNMATYANVNQPNAFLPNPFGMFTLYFIVENEIIICYQNYFFNAIFHISNRLNCIIKY